MKIQLSKFPHKKVLEGTMKLRQVSEGGLEPHDPLGITAVVDCQHHSNYPNHSVTTENGELL